MKRRRFALAFVLLACVAGHAAAQEQAPPNIETVIVTASKTGPAIWHVTNGSADVAILGIVQPLPYNFVWNTKPLQALLANARLVMLPPVIKMGLLDGAWFLLTKRDLMRPPDGKTLWDVLDPRVAADLAKLCDFLHEPKDRYSDNSPILAATRLGSDFRHVAYLTTHEPEDAVRALARARGVRVMRIGTYDLIPSAEELLKLPPDTAGQCIEAEIADIQFQSKHVQQAAQAWAIGDVSGTMANWSRPATYDCLTRLSDHADAIGKRSVDDTVSAIKDALAQGGNSIALVDVGQLLRKDGVLERLRAQGVSVAAPVSREGGTP